MKHLLAFILLLLIPSAALASSWLTEHTGVRYNLTLSPPHNEPVVGDKVARYRLQIKPSVQFKYLRNEVQIDLWGCQTWRTPSQVGHGIPDAWQNSDWDIETVRVGITERMEIGPQRLHGFTEYYIPVDRRAWGGHGMERHYYWLIGIGGTLW